MLAMIVVGGLGLLVPSRAIDGWFTYPVGGNYWLYTRQSPFSILEWYYPGVPSVRSPKPIYVIRAKDGSFHRVK
jgi:hypothetical protein